MRCQCSGGAHGRAPIFVSCRSSVTSGQRNDVAHPNPRQRLRMCSAACNRLGASMPGAWQGHDAPKASLYPVVRDRYPRPQIRHVESPSSPPCGTARIWGSFGFDHPSRMHVVPPGGYISTSAAGLCETRPRKLHLSASSLRSTAPTIGNPQVLIYPFRQRQVRAPHAPTSHTHLRVPLLHAGYRPTSLLDTHPRSGDLQEPTCLPPSWI